MFDDSLVLLFGSTKIKSIRTREYRDTMKGLRLGQYRPNLCKVIHVGKDFVLDDASLYETLMDAVNSMAPFTDPEVLYSEWVDTIQRTQFVNRIGNGKEEV